MARIFWALVLTVVAAAPLDARADACHSDADCVMIQSGCCPCGQSGGKRAVGRESAAAHRREIAARCGGETCLHGPIDASCNSVAVCVRRHCVAKPKMALPH